MKNYLVTMPMTGHVSLAVQAEDEQGAICAFWDRLETITDIDEEAEDIGWEYCEHVTEGNVTHAELNDVEVELLK